MLKQLLISLPPLLTMVFLLTGCEKNQPAPEKKNQLEKSVPEKNTPSSETVTEVKEAERTGDEKKSVPLKKPLNTDPQKYEGSKSLKRYLDDSP